MHFSVTFIVNACFFAVICNFLTSSNTDSLLHQFISLNTDSYAF
jgi:hypothetical protein